MSGPGGLGSVVALGKLRPYLQPTCSPQSVTLAVGWVFLAWGSFHLRVLESMAKGGQSLSWEVSWEVDSRKGGELGGQLGGRFRRLSMRSRIRSASIAGE